MAIILCKSCGKRVSDQWPECPGCGIVPGTLGTKSARRQGLNPAPHYLIAAVLSTIGGLIYGAHLIGRISNPHMHTAGMVMIALGICWYAATRILASMR